MDISHICFHQLCLFVWIVEKERRPYLATECEDVKKAEKFRRQIIGEVSKKVAQIQNAGLGEFKLRDLNDEINKLLREKGHWEDRVSVKVVLFMCSIILWLWIWFWSCECFISLYMLLFLKPSLLNSYRNMPLIKIIVEWLWHVAQ